MRKTSTTVYLEPDQLEELRQIVEATGIPMAVLIRAGIDRELAIRKARLKRRKDLQRRRAKVDGQKGG